MARLGALKKKKNPHATELRQLKKEVQRLTEQLESYKRELAEEQRTGNGDGRNPACYRQLTDRFAAGVRCSC